MYARRPVTVLDPDVSYAKLYVVPFANEMEYGKLTVPVYSVMPEQPKSVLML
jgi:hypothetical protein